MNAVAQQFDLGKRFPEVLLVGNGGLTSLAELNGTSNKRRKIRFKNALELMNVEVLTLQDIDANDYIGLYKQATIYIKNRLKKEEGDFQNEEEIYEDYRNTVSA